MENLENLKKLQYFLPEEKSVEFSPWISEISLCCDQYIPRKEDEQLLDEIKNILLELKKFID